MADAGIDRAFLAQQERLQQQALLDEFGDDFRPPEQQVVEPALD
jgi:hypothetical protein